MALLQMSPPEDSTLDSTSTDTIMNLAAADNNPGCRASPRKKAGKGREARTKPKEANVAETRTATATNRVALETNADGGVSVTTGTPTSTGNRTSERRGRTSAADAHPSSSSAHPWNVDPPSGNSGYYNLPWYPLYSLVPVSPGLHPSSVHTTVIDYSRHETTYGPYRNYGQHMTNHGSDTTHIHHDTYPSSQIHGVYFGVISGVVSELA